MSQPVTLRRSYFIAGTDTGVGKTLFSCALLRAAAKAGYQTVAMKPVAAGGVQIDGGLRNDDALLLQAASTEVLSYEEVNPFCLETPVSPHIAAAHAGRRLKVERIAGFCHGLLMRRANLTVIEGAGGWRVPLNDNETLADLAKMLKLPVILVVGLRLGCLNHALLTAEAIYRDGLALAGWVANSIDPDMQERAANVATLQKMLPAPLLADIPWLPNADIEQAAALVDINTLFPKNA